MKFLDLLRLANRNLLRSKLRTFLTVMAIFVGSFTLILTNGIGDGLKAYIETQVKNIDGANILFVTKKMPDSDDTGTKPGEPQEYQDQKPKNGEGIDPNSMSASVSQIKDATSGINEIVNITPALNINAEYISVDGGKKYLVELGTLSKGLEIKLEVGKKFDGVGQTILPVQLARKISPNLNNLLGKTATIAYKNKEGLLVKRNLQIVGVATRGMRANKTTFVDSASAEEISFDETGQTIDEAQFFSFTLRLNTSDPAAIKDVKKRLDAKGLVGYSIADIKKQTYDAIGIIQIGMNLFAVIALFAASFGIVNTLIIAVMERTKLIGLQKALGMSRGKIFTLFSLESILLGFWGAALGILFGILVGFIANAYLAQTYLESFEGYRLFVFTPKSLSLIMLLVCSIAFIAGVLPAYRASRLDPIDALRYE